MSAYIYSVSCFPDGDSVISSTLLQLHSHQWVQKYPVHSCGFYVHIPQHHKCQASRWEWTRGDGPLRTTVKLCGGCRLPITQRCGKRGITSRVINPLRVAACQQADIELYPILASIEVVTVAVPVYFSGLLQYSMFDICSVTGKIKLVCSWFKVSEFRLICFGWF